MEKAYKIAVVGATGAVGREMLNVLEERGFPVGELVPMASTRSAGETLPFGDKHLKVQIATAQALREGEFDIVLMSAGGKTSAELAPAAAAGGAVVIDNSSQWRMHAEVPLVVPEVNPQDLANYEARRIVANPNCSTIQMLVALAPLHRKARLQRVVVSTYQAVSGAGKKAQEELGKQVSDLFNQRGAAPEVLPKQIAFNCLPHIDVFLDDGFTKEERKMRDETRKMLGDADIGVCATCVRVPVFNGHAEAIVAQFHDPMDADTARELLREAPGIMLMDEPQSLTYPTQIDVVGSDATFIGRLRDDPSAANTIAFWCVADNLRKGAATNAVQIAELLVRDYLG